MWLDAVFRTELKRGSAECNLKGSAEIIFINVQTFCWYLATSIYDRERLLQPYLPNEKSLLRQKRLTVCRKMCRINLFS